MNIFCWLRLVLSGFQKFDIKASLFPFLIFITRYMNGPHSWIFSCFHYFWPTLISYWFISKDALHLYAEVPCASISFTVSDSSFVTAGAITSYRLLWARYVWLAYISMLVFRRGHHHRNFGYVSGGIWYGNQQARRSESHVFFLFDVYFITYAIKYMQSNMSVLNHWFAQSLLPCYDFHVLLMINNRFIAWQFNFY